MVVTVVKVREVGKFIRDQRAAAELSLRKLSKLTGVSNPYLSQIERGLRRPSAEILQAIAKALRISAETLYVKAGILDERVESVDPIAGILRDGTLTERQRQMLVDLYTSFREASRETPGRKAGSGRRAAARPAVRKKAPRGTATAGVARKRTPAKRTPAKRGAAKRARATAVAAARVPRRRPRRARKT